MYSFVNTIKGSHIEKPFGAKLQIHTGQRDFEHIGFGGFGSFARKGVEAVPSNESICNIPNENNQFNDCGKCMSILAVDDDDFNILALKSLLQRYGFQNVDYASNGSEALKKIKQKAQTSCHDRYKIIFMDCQMPVMNGYDTTKTIRNLISQKAIPDQLIIGVTGNADRDSLNECIKSGMNDTISKPLTKQSLYDKLSQWLG